MEIEFPSVNPTLVIFEGCLGFDYPALEKEFAVLSENSVVNPTFPFLIGFFI